MRQCVCVMRTCDIYMRTCDIYMRTHNLYGILYKTLEGSRSDSRFTADNRGAIRNFRIQNKVRNIVAGDKD